MKRLLQYVVGTKDWGGNVIGLSKKPRKCPICKQMHRHPTEDKLCASCEKDWIEATGCN